MTAQALALEDQPLDLELRAATQCPARVREDEELRKVARAWILMNTVGIVWRSQAISKN